jgi:septal ring factor EnvC (AmiA/AmiB activator)
MKMVISSRIIILTVLLALLSGGFSAFGADRADDKKKLQRIKREMREKKKKLKRVDRKERSILSDLQKIDRNIQKGSKELASQRRRLRESEKALQEVEQSNTALNRELDALKKYYGRRLRALYKLGRGGYAAAVLTPKDLAQTLKWIKYLGVIAERDRAIMGEYDNALAELAEREALIAEKKNELLSRRRVVESKKSALKARRRKKAVILASVRQKKGLYEQSLRELEESSAKLWAMIKRSERARNWSRSTAVNLRKDKKRLPWPLKGQVLTRFGMQRHPKFGTMVFRRGIEIKAREGESVRAVRDGQVAYADWYKGYGKLVILDHGGGFYTLYGNLSRLDKKKGARVSKGQVLGLSGETGSLKGPTLYFEIRRNGEAQDPLKWLARK